MDLKLKDEGNGGEVIYEDFDLTTIFGLGNLIYLALFGGNNGHVTPSVRAKNDQAFDFWANSFLPAGQQFNSRTEHTISNVALNSQGRAEIEKSAKKDLEFLSEFADVSVVVIIEDEKKCSINVQIDQPDNLENPTFRFIWDASSSELISEEI